MRKAACAARVMCGVKSKKIYRMYRMHRMDKIGKGNRLKRRNSTGCIGISGWIRWRILRGYISKLIFILQILFILFD
jgi:hypothetical protein